MEGFRLSLSQGGNPFLILGLNVGDFLCGVLLENDLGLRGSFCYFCWGTFVLIICSLSYITRPLSAVF